MAFGGEYKREDQLIRTEIQSILINEVNHLAEYKDGGSRIKYFYSNTAPYRKEEKCRERKVLKQIIQLILEGGTADQTYIDNLLEDMNKRKRKWWQFGK